MAVLHRHCDGSPAQDTAAYFSKFVVSEYFDGGLSILTFGRTEIVQHGWHRTNASDRQPESWKSVSFDFFLCLRFTFLKCYLPILSICCLLFTYFAFLKCHLQAGM